MTSPFAISTPPSPKSGQDWRSWAADLINYMRSSSQIEAAEVTAQPILLSHRIGIGGGFGERAGQPGILMFDPSANLPNFSDGSEWKAIPNFSYANTNNETLIIGTVMIQWGVEAYSGATVGDTVTFDNAFGANPVVCLNPDNFDSTDEDLAFSVMARSVGTTSFILKASRIEETAPTTTPVSNEIMNVAWMAIGVVP